MFEAVRFGWLATMPAKNLLAAFFVGALASIAAFTLGIQLSNQSPEPRSTPNAMCFADTNPEQFSERHIQTKLFACQVVGMTKAEGIEFLESRELVVRIAMEDGEYFALTEDYTDARVNLEIISGLVVGASAW